MFVTFTPFKGYTEVVRGFLYGGSPDRGVVRMGLKDAEHFTEEEKAQRLAAYPAHQREARETGSPMLGSGGVFEDVMEADIRTSMRLADVPKHWPLLWGIDFGIAHPFAAVLIAWDRDADVIYVVDCFKMSGGTPINHAGRMRGIAANARVAYPHDGAAREAGSGDPLAALYKAEGLQMLPSHATHASGGYSTEAGVQEILGRMRNNQFKVCAHLTEWFEEFRQYHRDKGLIVKVFDDLMSATRIACMARRFAREAPLGSKIMRRDPGPDGFMARDIDFPLFAPKPAIRLNAIERPVAGLDPHSGWARHAPLACQNGPYAAETFGRMAKVTICVDYQTAETGGLDDFLVYLNAMQ
jgi:hypothetical protein